MAERQALRAQNDAGNNAVNCREEKLEAARQAENAAAIKTAQSRKTKVDSIVGLDAVKTKHNSGTLGTHGTHLRT